MDTDPKTKLSIFARLKEVDPRKTIGLKAYQSHVNSNILKVVKQDIAEGHYIEAYSITDQYLDVLLKHMYSDLIGSALPPIIQSVDK